MTDSQINLKEIEFRYPEGSIFQFDALRGAFWVEKKTLIVSDLHLGKAGHFRKNGIPVPSSVHENDLNRLGHLVQKYDPRRIIFLGDLFHSDYNEEWQNLIAWSEANSQIVQVLIKGNHDILDKSLYDKTRIYVEDELIDESFHFTHEPMNSSLHNIAGHIHPGVRLNGHARQGLTLPCFHIAPKQTILPAFGSFTGNFKIKPRKDHHIFALTEGSIVALMV